MWLFWVNLLFLDLQNDKWMLHKCVQITATKEHKLNSLWKQATKLMNQLSSFQKQFWFSCQPKNFQWMAETLSDYILIDSGQASATAKCHREWPNNRPSRKVTSQAEPATAQQSAHREPNVSWLCVRAHNVPCCYFIYGRSINNVATCSIFLPTWRHSRVCNR